MAQQRAKPSKTLTGSKPVASQETVQLWKGLKKSNPQQLLLLRHAGNYISVGKDAQTIAQALGRPLEKEGRISFIQFGHAAAHKAYLDKLRQAGHSITFCDISEQEFKMESHYSHDTKVTVEEILDEVRIGIIAKTLYESGTKNKRRKTKVKL